MSEFSNRLGLVRKKLGFTQRKFAKDLSVSHATYSSWELGKTQPVAGVLEYLCGLGVNGHWLLTGAGTMMWDDRTPSEAVFSGTAPGDYERLSRQEASYLREGYAPQSQADLIRETQLREMEEMGLGNLFIMSRRGTQGAQWQILIILKRAGNGLTLRALQIALEKEAKKNLSPLDILADLQLLQQDNLVSLEDDLWKIQDMPTIDLLFQADRLQAAKTIISGLGKHILPALNRDDYSGWIGLGSFSVTDPKRSLASLKNLIHSFTRENHAENGVELVLYIAASTVSSPKN